ncbi:hypothetical protein HMPREF1544_06420 [Mucor circinelloides 1006PhL]|uniref:Signal transducer n=1 Tax=Mucor circinelloides f. circinelloides (strain 1006PhL) TaxID=1220926 RepID=S2JAU7_MUCC1|nr:hypothetical protein HMPREF1544_06420 [Mucor circinelloides 1006PhL]
MTTDEVILPNCQGCSKLIEEGAVVAFGDSLFHVKCFICAKCGECVDNKTNLLLLDDGRPVCDNCSYTCVACSQVIRDEAIMTGEKAYHSSCFKCISCNKTIDDLIFTQTAKGIYCTACNEIRKAEKSSKRAKVKKKLNSDLEFRSMIDQPKLPTPVRSRSNSLIQKTGMESSSSSSTILPDFTFSFFENDSSELDNLSNTLGANLSLNESSKAHDESTLQYRIKRASEILQSSLRTSSLSKSSFEPTTATHNEELMETRSRLKELEADYKVLQDASQQALNEFTQLKDDFERDANIKRQQEFTIVSLMKKSGGLLSRKEIDKLAYLRVELERTCKELIHYRDKIAAAIDANTTSSTVYSSYQKSLKSQIKSLTQERDALKSQTKNLTASRDEIIHEMEEATSTHLDAMPLSNSPPLSPSQSSDTSCSIISPPTMQQRPRRPSNASSVMFNVSSRKSFISDQTPTLFRLKKKGSTMFGKLGATTSTSTSTKSSKLEAPTAPMPTTSTSSSSSIFRTTSRSIYNNPNYSSSLQSLSYQDSNSLGKSSKKSFMDSSVSLSYAGHESHSFQPTSFLRPVKCGSCGDKIWGRSEYRCDGCGFSSHSRCLSKVPQQCTAAQTSSSFDLGYPSSASFDHAVSPIDTENKPLPQQPKKSTSECGLFGTDLSERVKAENRSVPLIVQECIKEVEARGLDYEGIYRKSGGAAQIRAIQLAFENDESINLSDEEEYNDICAITSVLKQYFRDLPNPLLTCEHYDSFIQVSTLDHNEKKIEAFSNILHQLPKAHYDTIALLFQHLVKVYQQSDANRMSVKNLAMVFAPTLMRHSDASRDFLDISYKNATIEYILLHTVELFSTSSPAC